MRQRLRDLLRSPPVLGWRDLVLVLLPMAIWAACFTSRQRVIVPKCAVQPALCAPETVPFPDRLTLGMQNTRADQLSFVTQRYAGYVGLGLPAAWTAFRIATGALAPPIAAAILGTDLLITLETVLWNGAVTEGVRLAVQRPRPFVYIAPALQGVNPAHYTSFISGHTSFAAAITLAALLILVGRSAPTGLLGTSFAASIALIFLTGLFRVMAGRHFITDVTAAAVSGAILAVAIALLHRRSTPRGMTSVR